MEKLSVARKAAFKILREISTGVAHSDQLLRAKAIGALGVADRNLVQALVLGVLRWQMVLDARVNAHLEKPNAKIDPGIRIALRMAAFQILCMDRIPARAAIDESVELTKLGGHRFAAGLVNAVLRKLAEANPTAATDFAAEEAYPAWLVERWTSFYGPESTQAICRHGQTQPVIAVRIDSPAVEAELAAGGILCEPGQLLTAARKLVSGDAAHSAAFQSGQLRIQDEGSQLVAELAGQGDTILDCCAAPGGKTMILAERNPNARIVANEFSDARLGPLRKRLRPYGERVECRLGDASKLPKKAIYDLILADVPCSGTGTLGRNPEIRFRLSPRDLAHQAERQGAILTSALRALRTRGKLIYSTCSLEPEENEQAIATLRAANLCVRPLSLAPRIVQLQQENRLAPGAVSQLLDCLTPEGALRLLPGALGTDGFFVAMIEKV